MHTQSMLLCPYSWSLIQVCIGDEDCNVDEVTEFIESKISHAELESSIGFELTYRLSAQQVHKFTNLFKGLETNMYKLKLSSFGVIAPTLGETFLKISGNSLSQKHTEASLEKLQSKCY